ncbi:condensin complex subunit 2 [Engraulis encrasicolus]|uniref:condensin complex subunit 2 n=1 Tax=Engraulis encrasicolus TaxID=184585 RepID=UPI002FCE799B
MSAVSTPTPRVRQWSSPSLGPKAAPPATSTPRLGCLPSNDDEQERRQRRRSRIVDLQGGADSSFNDSATHSRADTPAAVPKLSTAQISEHYSTCIKLSTENKITTKNAFGLHLIDYMADILKQKDSELNFKVAAGTLDASTKIYAVRVDAVHADAYRVLGGLGSETKPKEAAGPEEGEDAAANEEGAAAEATAAKQATKKKRPPKKTVEQNLGNINRSESEMKCEVDPMFQRMAASFDENSTAGVFLSVLFSEDSRCELRFPSHMTLLHTRPPCSAMPAQHVSAQHLTGGLKSLQDRPICPSLGDFSFTRWSPDQTMNQMLEKMKQGEHVFDVNADIEQDEDECQDFGDNFDADSEEVGQGDFGGEGYDEHRENCAAGGTEKRGVIPIGKADITTMCLQLSAQPREYSYFSPKTLASWVGPDYWLIKPGQKQDQAQDKEARKRAPKNALVIDFTEDIHFHNYFKTTRETSDAKVPGDKSFSQSTRVLLQKLPGTMASNLSVPLAFVALLHLANEKTLSLQKVDDMTDIIIKQDH